MSEDDDTILSHAATKLLFSRAHLATAKRFADALVQHEGDYADKEFGAHFEVCRDYGTSCLILSCAAVEAGLNEALYDLSLVEEEVWPRGKSFSLLERAKVLVKHVGGAFDLGRPAAQSVKLLSEIRNALVHPQAEWSNMRDKQLLLSRKIVKQRLHLSRFSSNPEFAFPEGCMSGSIAQWAVASAQGFIAEFRSAAKLP